MIQPRTPKGFRDFLPELMMPREALLEATRRVCRQYGFAPIDTPAVEYAEVLLGKGGDETDRQVYRFQHDRHDLALRFDLTVPFARFAAQHAGQLGMPFKRYHVGPVWRGENTQRGRYREFWQCDFDTIGTTANAADAETVLVIHDLMAALGFERFEIRINNRMLVNGLLEKLGLADRATQVLRILDKLPKVGTWAVAEELTRPVEEGGAGVEPWQSRSIFDFSQMAGNNREILRQLKKHLGDNINVYAAEGISRLENLLDVCQTAGTLEPRLRLDLSIARGLDYYTGTIFETFLLDLPTIGSVCSGGRYDDLAGLYTKQKLPGVGASLGLDRLLAAMEELCLLPKASTPAPVFVVQFDASRLGDYQRMARQLRAQGLGVEVFPEAKKVGQQLQYADRRGFKVALIAGADEFAAGAWNVKDLARKEERGSVPEAEVVGVVRKILEQ